jgi:DNA-binding response OmpR family regulator
MNTIHAMPFPLCPGAAATTKAATPQTILLVEDDDNLRFLLRSFLTKKGYTVLDAGLNSSAFLMAGRYDRPIDLMIVDLMMPGTTGHDLAVRLKAWRPEMKVLYISGQPKDVIERKRLLEPDDVLLPKPFDPQLLLETARLLLASDATSGAGHALKQGGSSLNGSITRGARGLVASIRSLLHLNK